MVCGSIPTAGFHVVSCIIHGTRSAVVQFINLSPLSLCLCSPRTCSIPTTNLISVFVLNRQFPLLDPVLAVGSPSLGVNPNMNCLASGSTVISPSLSSSDANLMWHFPSFAHIMRLDALSLFRLLGRCCTKTTLFLPTCSGHVICLILLATLSTISSVDLFVPLSCPLLTHPSHKQHLSCALMLCSIV